MRRVLLYLTCLTMGLHVHSAWAVNIQYLLSGGHVIGVSETSIGAVEGRGVLEFLSSTAEEIVWPVPSGCSTGKPSWTRITNAATAAADGTGMAIRTDLLWFTTTSTLLLGCHEMSSAEQLWDLVNVVLNSALFTGNPLTAVSGDMNVNALTICPPSDVSGDCTTLRADMVTWNAVAGGAAAAMHAFMVQAQILFDEATAFIAANF